MIAIAFLLFHLVIVGLIICFELSELSIFIWLLIIATLALSIVYRPWTDLMINEEMRGNKNDI